MTGPYRVVESGQVSRHWAIYRDGREVVDPMPEYAKAYAEALCGMLNAAPADEPLDETLRRLAEGKLG